MLKGPEQFGLASKQDPASEQTLPWAEVWAWGHEDKCVCRNSTLVLWKLPAAESISIDGLCISAFYWLSTGQCCSSRTGCIQLHFLCLCRFHRTVSTDCTSIQSKLALCVETILLYSDWNSVVLFPLFFLSLLAYFYWVLSLAGKGGIALCFKYRKEVCGWVDDVLQWGGDEPVTESRSLRSPSQHP